jgi:hypothetical protein
MATANKLPPTDAAASIEAWDKFYRQGAGDRSKMKAAQAARDKEYIVSVPRAQQAIDEPEPIVVKPTRKKGVKRK